MGATVDCVDGDLARLRVELSKSGEWLDSVADDVSTFGLLAGMGAALGGSWLILAAIGVVSGAGTAVKLYSDLHRMKRPIDTARYPWFFERPAAAAAGAKRGLARAVNAASYVFKRDAYATIVAICLAAGLVRLAFLLLFGGIEVITVLLLVHLTVTHAEPRPPV
jgi:phosphatidylglycerophosphate synthase